MGDVRCDPLVEYDPNFMMDLKFFEEEVYWVQKIRSDAAARHGNVTGFLVSWCATHRVASPKTLISPSP